MTTQTLIHGGAVLTVDDAFTIHDPGWVHIDGTRDQESLVHDHRWHPGDARVHRQIVLVVHLAKQWCVLIVEGRRELVARQPGLLSNVGERVEVRASGLGRARFPLPEPARGYVALWARGPGLARFSDVTLK